MGVGQELTCKEFKSFKLKQKEFNSFKLRQKKSPHPPHINIDRCRIARFSLPERIISPYELPELVTLGTDLIFGYCLVCCLLFACNLNDDSYAMQPFLSLGINHICSLVVHMLLAFLTLFLLLFHFIVYGLCVYGCHRRENTGSRLFTEVEPCWTGLISGWVTI